MTISSVVPQARSLGNKAFYEAIFRNVFAGGRSVLRRDLRSYCLATLYGSGSQLDGAVGLMLNLGVLIADGEYLRADAEFLLVLEDGEIGLGVATRLIGRLAASGEIDSLFPIGSLSWGRSDKELDIRLSQIPMQSLPIIKLLRDLEVVQDSEEGTALLKALEPFSRNLADAVTIAFQGKRSRKALSPEQLDSLEEAQARQGAEAEEYVLRYEQGRLQGHLRLHLVQRISLVNAAAGYDIESFDGVKSLLPDRFIEVKSHSGIEHFFISEGELEAARELGERYYLYLVDMEKCQLPMYCPVIIRNPVVELFARNSAWSTTPIRFEVARKTV